MGSPGAGPQGAARGPRLLDRRNDMVISALQSFTGYPRTLNALAVVNEGAPAVR